MPKLTNAQLKKAAKQFLAEKPDIIARILSLTEEDADFMGTSLEQLRLDRTMDEIDKYAHQNNRDPMELRFSLAAETFEEYDKMWENHKESIKRSLGT
jgi:hypothetical protein